MKHRIRPYKDFYIVERQKNLFTKWEEVGTVANPHDVRYIEGDNIKIAKKAVKALKEIQKADRIVFNGSR